MTLTKDGHPTPEAIRAMVARMRAGIEEYRPRIVMMESMVSPVCGTTCCHGGLYLLGKIALDEYTPPRPVPLHDFSDGATALSQDLGFEDQFALTHWARCNPDLWGCESGGGMFCADYAFPYPAVTPDVICNHWLAVAERIEAVDPRC